MATLLINIRGIDTLIEVTGDINDYEWYVPGGELLTLLLQENHEMEVCDLINKEIDKSKGEAALESAA